MKLREVGSIQAVLSGISTRVDQSIKISFDVLPDDQKVIAELLKAYTTGSTLFTLGIVQVEE